MAPGALRFLLATLVVVFHYTSFGIGHMPVYLFFALSGYWVFTMWQKKYAATREPYATFMISRTWRLAPVFLLCSLSAMAISFALPLVIAPALPFAPPDPLALISSFVLLGYNTAAGAPLVPAWSLDIEFQFYLVAPFVIALLQRRALLAVLLCAGVSVASFAVFYDRASTSYLPWFLAGMLAARYPALLPRPRVAQASGLLTLGVVVLFACVPALRPALFGGAHRGEIYMTWNPLLNAALAAVALPFALGTLSVRSGKFDRLLSDASYSLYLVHWLPLLYVSHYLPQIAALPHFSRALATMPQVLLSYAAAFAITVYVDRPCSRVRERFVKTRHATHEQPAAATLATRSVR
ncbi:acyltransferase [Paraburkholderia sp. Ac-20340]|uniref:acyltransferase family protein n=1 Tax=Paraburkholderia sp. Ac-20340 TaxID=2703888 RepID=UPI001982662C|nr:acyltransferase [Paraburkholderia sp. Ac-20340]MBN3858035.1 acyltransferase [Paraburkholderia sp. Ac-20340]